jgi:hypothetical protein
LVYVNWAVYVGYVADMNILGLVNLNVFVVVGLLIHYVVKNDHVVL